MLCIPTPSGLWAIKVLNIIVKQFYNMSSVALSSAAH